jgi:dTDP-4-amino-4,6-dideoxygalactose transaminase
MIPLCDLNQQYLSLEEALVAALRQVAASGQYILGPHVKALEQEIAEFCGCRYAVGVGNGTDALQLVLRALEIGPGDEVITTPFTFVATSEAIGLVGAKPVFVDIDPYTYNIDPSLVEAAITRHTKAILPVHLYGQPCDMAPLIELAGHHRLVIVEDCAQAIGARYLGRAVGSFGAAGCFSFFPSKNLGCMGDGGMITTCDRSLYERVETLRRHGGKVKYRHSELGLNSRLDEIQAAVLRVKLKYLEAWNERRRLLAYRYNELLNEADEIVLPFELDASGYELPIGEAARENGLLTPVYHQYTVQVERRDEVAVTLRNRGVQSFPYYPVPLHLQEVHAHLGHRPGDFPVAEQVAQRCLSLPMFPELTGRQQRHVVDSLLAVTVNRPSIRAAAA